MPKPRRKTEQEECLMPPMTREEIDQRLNDVAVPIYEAINKLRTLEMALFNRGVAPCKQRTADNDIPF